MDADSTQSLERALIQEAEDWRVLIRLAETQNLSAHTRDALKRQPALFFACKRAQRCGIQVTRKKRQDIAARARVLRQSAQLILIERAVKRDDDERIRSKLCRIAWQFTPSVERGLRFALTRRFQRGAYKERCFAFVFD